MQNESNFYYNSIHTKSSKTLINASSATPDVVNIKGKESKAKDIISKEMNNRDLIGKEHRNRDYTSNTTSTNTVVEIIANF